MIENVIKHYDTNGRPIFQSANEFSMYIEKKASEDRLTVLETMVQFIDDYDVEAEQLKQLISQSLRNKLEKDFIDAGLMRQKPSLKDFLY